jgi:hypothetical protein
VHNVTRLARFSNIRGSMYVGAIDMYPNPSYSTNGVSDLIPDEMISTIL